MKKTVTMQRRRKLMFVCGEDWSFVSHRLGLGRAALVRGDEVIVACNANEAAVKLRAEGFRVVDVPIARGGLSPIKSLKTIKALASLIRRERPDIVINVAIQCVVLSALAGLLVGVRRSVNMVTGLGFMFVSNGAKARLVRSVVSMLMRAYARWPSIHVIVQNSDDFELMRGLGFSQKRLSLVRGSGVDIRQFFPGKPERRHDERKTAIFVARMLWSKGLAELVEAAGILKDRGFSYRVLLVGDIDPANPDSADMESLVKWQQDGLLEWLGKRSDIADLLRQSDLAVLPSWREGLPKSLLEAAASGLAMVASDVPGCREIVKHNQTGFLVPMRDAGALAQAIEDLMEDDTKREALGRNARILVEQELCDAVVIRKTLDIISA
ncbi:glycosyltransferase family 4 protein [Thalassospira xiamenensis]|uniref:Glycosyltransferase involved in cell wall bisynthesis n=1 Tax=Thalassospira xiamenensis TaxID=220697 RepID=A0A285TZ66_9PROT|nr:glycosyltransferase family 4 protein [Thalassospira xiamenensis]SOC30676.1 Glycosyltransferase involved in cell wall bisynthesis [Thalassospira xiamenensis]